MYSVRKDGLVKFLHGKWKTPGYPEVYGRALAIFYSLLHCLLVYPKDAFSHQ
jgi:hypothetical protein